MNEKKQNDAAASSSAGNGPDSEIFKDQRFAHLVADPRFKNIYKSTKSVKIDNRFKSMFQDDKFKVKYTIDKYGRRVNKSSTDDLEKYYELSSEDEEELAEEQRKEEQQLITDGGDANELHESDEEIADSIKSKLQDLTVDYARGELPLLSDSSSDDESSEDEDDKELFIEHVWGELDIDAPSTEDSTYRLAACNMDWDRIRASDIMVLCSSFLPPGGSILKVSIYPSEFGKERLAEEEVKGPQELTEHRKDEDDSDFDESDSAAEGENEDGVDYHMEKLRQYQLNRLKYYYAVIECNNVRAADKLYAECDGIEYESTATKLDLRFIPDDMTFDDEPKEVCTEMPDLNKYKPRLFTTTALQQAKVELTWDENDVDRVELNEKVNTGKLSEIPDAELRKFVAYSSEEEEDELPEETASQEHDESESDQDDSVADKVEKNGKKSKKPNKKVDRIAKYKNLLSEINAKEEAKKKNRIEMEFSWDIDNSKKSVKKEADASAELTPFEKIIEKKREKKLARKQMLRGLKKAQKGGDASGSDDDDLPDGIDMNDPYFAEEFANGDFAPAKPKKTKGKKKQANNGDDTATDDSDNTDNQKYLELMIDDDDDNKAHFSLKKIQERENESKTSKKRRKNLKGKKDGDKKPIVEDNFEMNVTDSRFAAVYSSHLFNIDPTDSHYRKTKNMESLVHEKLKRKTSDTPVSDAGAEPSEKRRKNAATNVLVKSIKRKIQQQN